MNQLVTLPDMNLEEATAKHQELKAIHGVARSMLLEMRDRKGWKALGYLSFEDYGDKEWGYSRQHLNRLATAESTQKLLEPIGSKDIPETHLRPLNQVPDDIKKQIWDEVNEENRVVTAKLIEQAVAKYKADLLGRDDLIEKVRKQRDDWKGASDTQISQLTSKLNAVEEDKQKAINEAVIVERKNMQSALDLKKADAEKLSLDMVALKKLHEKTVDEKVKAKLSQMQIEINQKQYQIDSSEKRINALKLQELEMEQTFGKISRHNKALAEIQNLIELMFIPYGGILEDQEWDVPNDIISEWHKIEKSLQSALSTTSGICEKLHQPVLRVIND
jgi:polyhydroxyalkanoate synthesis regulator phasin